jgi:hypothetical protein
VVEEEKLVWIVLDKEGGRGGEGGRRVLSSLVKGSGRGR